MLSVSTRIAASFGLRAQAAASAQGSFPRRANKDRIVRLVPLASTPTSENRNAFKLESRKAKMLAMAPSWRGRRRAQNIRFARCDGTLVG